jgi:hypothetical protein
MCLQTAKSSMRRTRRVLIPDFRAVLMYFVRVFKTELTAKNIAVVPRTANENFPVAIALALKVSLALRHTYLITLINLCLDPCIKTLNTSCLCVQEMRECDPDICRCKCDCYNALVLTEKQKVRRLYSSHTIVYSYTAIESQRSEVQGSWMGPVCRH